jgi:hypothetical protein
VARHAPPRPRYGLSWFWRAPRKPLKDTLYFPGWIAAVGLPIALSGQAISEIAAGNSYGVVWILGAVLLLLLYSVYLRRPVERRGIADES